MADRLNKLLAPPKLDDPDDARVARLLNVMLLATVAMFVGLALFDPLIQKEPVPVIVFSLGSAAVLWLLRQQLFRGRVRQVAIAFSIIALLLVVAANFMFGGMSGPCDSMFVVVVLIAGFFVSSRFGVIIAGISVLFALALTAVEQEGMLPPPVSPITPIIHWTTLAVAVLLGGLLLHMAVTAIREGLEHARAKERELAKTNLRLEREVAERERANHEVRRRRAELEELNRELETRVEQRTAALEEKLQLIEKQRVSIEQLSVPIIQIWEEILTLPIVGAVDTRRSEQITEALLERVAKTQSRFIIIDVTGVDVVDTQTASLFGKMVAAVELLGAQCILTGISPQIAQTLTEIGADLGNVATRRSLKDGLKESLARLRRLRAH
jgi:rsbT co-antagonist protein RsbR